MTKTDQFPLPQIDDMLDQLGRAKYFTNLDLAAGNWQVKMCPDTKKKTVFITYQGLYEFNIMPFGLKNIPCHLSTSRAEGAPRFDSCKWTRLCCYLPERCPDFLTFVRGTLDSLAESIGRID